MFFRKKKPRSESLTKKLKEIDFDKIEDEEDVLDIIEITAKSIKIDVKDIGDFLKKIADEIPHIHELKAEIKALKAELREEKEYNRELIKMLVNKPAPPSAAALYQANKAAERESEAKKLSGFAAIDKKAS